MQFDADTKELVFYKSGAHEERPPVEFKPTPRYGFVLASLPKELHQAPTTESAERELHAWASCTDSSGEPFALSLYKRATASCASICRMVCREGSACGRAPKCKFVAQAHYDEEHKTFYITKKNGHIAGDQRHQTDEAIRPRYIRRKAAPGQWLVGKDEVLNVGTCPEDINGLHQEARAWAGNPKSNGAGRPFTVIAREAQLADSPRLLRSELACSSCQNREACTWTGLATFDTHTRRLCMQYHGDHDNGPQRKRYGVMTPAQEHAWKTSGATTGIGKLGAFAWPSKVMANCTESARKRGEQATTLPKQPSGPWL